MFQTNLMVYYPQWGALYPPDLTLHKEQIKIPVIKKVRCYEVKIEKSEKGRQPPGVEPRTPLGWWLSGCRGSVAEHWRLKPKVSWVRLPAAAGLFHFPLFLPHNI